MTVLQSEVFILHEVLPRCFFGKTWETAIFEIGESKISFRTQRAQQDEKAEVKLLGLHSWLQCTYINWHCNDFESMSMRSPSSREVGHFASYALHKAV